jgi:hypothetical protein
VVLPTQPLTAPCYNHDAHVPTHAFSC